MNMVVAILTCYNESKTLRSTLQQLLTELERLGEGFRIVIVDDGSTDASPELYRQFTSRGDGRVEAIRFDENRGIGAVFRAGLARARGLVKNPDDMIVIVEADGTNELELLGRMREETKRGAGLVVASRHSKGSSAGGRKYRMFLSRAVSYYLRRRFRHLSDIREFSYFFKAMSAEALENAYRRYGDRLITSDGFVSSAEIVIKLLSSGTRAVEFPTRYFYQDSSKSKLRVWSTIREYLTLFRRLKRDL